MNIRGKPKFVSKRTIFGKTMYQACCPKCRTAGSDYIDKQPLCHNCGALMHPYNSSYDVIVCTFEEFQEYMKEKGYDIS